MSRAAELTLALILLQASIGFIASIGLFPAQYLDVPTNNASYNITDLESYASVKQESPLNILLTAAYWAWEAFFIGIKILLTVIFVLPTLVNVFNVPTALAVFIQAGVYFTYAIWYSQYKSGRGWKQYE